MPWIVSGIIAIVLPSQPASGWYFTLMFAVIVYLGQEYFSWYDLRNCTAAKTTLVVSQALIIATADPG